MRKASEYRQKRRSIGAWFWRPFAAVAGVTAGVITGILAGVLFAVIEEWAHKVAVEQGRAERERSVSGS